MSKSSLFLLTVAETGLATASSRNCLNTSHNMTKRRISKALIPGKGQDQGLAKSSHGMKMWHKYHEKHAQRVIRDVEFEGDIQFHFWPDGKSRSGKMRPNFKLKISSRNIPILSSFNEPPKMYFILTSDNCKC